MLMYSVYILSPTDVSIVPNESDSISIDSKFSSGSVITGIYKSKVFTS